ncbi:diguanylate cyclase [Chromatium okenii]|uniref:diguanylate cyclase n=1 Tax=Chromatium okenii TaxID=61644 RepID=UPI0026EF489A|nr:diguanylate cyclase [Chromatium okenii]MBV5308277.1 diguanylate cyclase [Chromatium okenii]
MDMKTLVIVGVVMALAGTFSMTTVFLTRRVYPGFGYWVLSILCRTLGSLLFLQRDQLSLWLTIILANTLFLLDIMLVGRGMRVFRNQHRPIHSGIEATALLSFIALFIWLTVIVPDIKMRILLWCVYTTLLMSWTVFILLTHRPAWFGSGDQFLALALIFLVFMTLIRAGYTQFFEDSLPNFMAASGQAVFILINIGATLLIILGQIIMNAQRIEYDYRVVQQALEQDIAKRKYLETQLREEAIRDPLTGLFNRRYLNESLQREFSRRQRSDGSLIIAMLDLDHFKRFNDHYGHEAGDAVLRAVSELLQHSLRREDIVCRYGGEEITMILSETTLAVAAARLDTVRHALTSLRIRHQEQDLPPITASIGLAAAEPTDLTPDMVLARADAALYRAKLNGRNRVEVNTTDFNIAKPSKTTFIRLIWRDCFLCGHALIDQQHRQLFNDANQLLDAIFAKESKPMADVNPLLDQLVHDLMQHFQDEEQVLMVVNYAELGEHAALHRALINQAIELVARFRAGNLAIGELLEFLAQDVVVKHILNEDRKFFGHVG